VSLRALEAPGWFDVHAHLTHPKLAPREAEVLAHAKRAGVTTIITNGLNPRDNEAVRALAARDPIVRPAYGLYPVDAVLEEMDAMGVEYPRDVPTDFTTEEAIAWVAAHAGEAFAIGEIGLDGYWVPEALWDKQEAAFRRLVAIAMEADKPIIIHTRKREQRAFEVLVEMGATRVDWHCFGGKVKLAERIAAHGHWLSIPANARKNEAFTRMLEKLPRDKILLETDCPYLGPDREVDNEPANVARTAEYAAELWKTSIDDVRARLTDNFTALFGTPP
jgi:TatD DNase family protein